jgi:hypothetical protein
MKTTKKAVKTAKKVTKPSKSAYSPKEIAEITSCMLKVLEAPTDATKEEMSGAVVVINQEKTGYSVQGGIRNISTAGFMMMILDILKMTPMDGAILLAQISGAKKNFDEAKKSTEKSAKKTKTSKK